jgi:hypothetical protein
MDTSDDLIILKIIFEKEDDDDVLLLHLSEDKIKKYDPLFKKGSTEGYHEILKEIFKFL